MEFAKCRCGGQSFEDIDITPPGVSEKRYFTRCQACGLVVYASAVAAEQAVSHKTSFLRRLSKSIRLS